MKRSRLFCVIMGPNTNDRNLIKDLALAGMDIARFNFSHETMRTGGRKICLN